VTVAVPVGAKSTIDDIAKEVDRVISALAPERLEAVSLFYRDFSPTSDEEVRELLADARKQRTAIRPGSGARENVG
jgi:predicted phosphoribosyltransferase